MTETDLSTRHPDTQAKMLWLTPNPGLPEGAPAVVAAMFHDVGTALLAIVRDGDQLWVALQHLVDAKDAAVRQALADGARTMENA
jgi:hypothetical protein